MLLNIKIISKPFENYLKQGERGISIYKLHLFKSSLFNGENSQIKDYSLMVKTQFSLALYQQTSLIQHCIKV